VILYFNTDAALGISLKCQYMYINLMKIQQYQNNDRFVKFSKIIMNRELTLPECYSWWDPRISFDSSDFFYINVTITGKLFRWCKVWGLVSSEHYSSST